MANDNLKEKRKKFGMGLAPIQATRAYRRSMPFDHKKVPTISWVLINDNTGMRTHVNTYNGVAGSGFRPEKAEWPIGDLKKLRRTLKDYQECPVADCPVAEQVAATVPVVPIEPPGQPVGAGDETQGAATGDAEDTETNDNATDATDAPEDDEDPE